MESTTLTGPLLYLLITGIVTAIPVLLLPESARQP